jgi:hypothetical protein
MQPEFESFPKIPRLSRDVTVTEKIDGSNVQVVIQRLPPEPPAFLHAVTQTVVYDNSCYAVFAGSRSRWVTLPAGSPTMRMSWSSSSARGAITTGGGASVFSAAVSAAMHSMSARLSPGGADGEHRWRTRTFAIIVRGVIRRTSPHPP